MTRIAWAKGAGLAALVAMPLAALELWSDPEPCVHEWRLVNGSGTACPHDDHETREIWSDDWSTLHLECICPD